MFFLDRHRLGARTDYGFVFLSLPALAFWGCGFLFVLILTSLLLDDRDFWLAFGLAVVLPLWVCRFATYDPAVVLGGCESSCERFFMVSSYTPGTD